MLIEIKDEQGLLVKMDLWTLINLAILHKGLPSVIRFSEDVKLFADGKEIPRPIEVEED